MTEWVFLIPLFISLVTLGDYYNFKKDTMAQITDVTAALKSLKDTVDNLVANLNTTTTATISQALDVVVSEINATQAEVASVVPPA